MIKSMTGYGIGETKRDGYHITAEIKTVNHRYSNIYLHMPGHLLALESTLHKILKERLDRGRIDLYLKIEEEAVKDAYIPQINHELARCYYNELKALKEALGFEQELTVETLISLPEVLKVKEADQDKDILHNLIIETVEKSIDSLIQMRSLEGQELYQDLIQRLDKIDDELEQITKRAPQALEEYKNRMKERINDILEDKTIDEDRLAMEIAILAERSCINEEVVRLKSHLGQFRESLNKSDSIGRKLDFIAQEMYRETNTIGSKANDSLIVSNVVNIKSEIDKIREQIQNIE